MPGVVSMPGTPRGSIENLLCLLPKPRCLADAVGLRSLPEVVARCDAELLVQRAACTCPCKASVPCVCGVSKNEEGWVKQDHSLKKPAGDKARTVTAQTGGPFVMKRYSCPVDASDWSW